MRRCRCAAARKGTFACLVRVDRGGQPGGSGEPLAELPKLSRFRRVHPDIHVDQRPIDRARGDPGLVGELARPPAGRCKTEHPVAGTFIERIGTTQSGGNMDRRALHQQDRVLSLGLYCVLSS